MASNLLLRDGIYSARYIVPTKYRELVGRRAFVRTLGTRDPKEAAKRAHRVLADLHDHVVRLVTSGADNPRDPRSLLARAAELNTQVNAGTLDADQASHLLSDMVDAHHALMGSSPDEGPEPATQATYYAAFETLDGTAGLLLGRAIDQFESHQQARGVRASTVTNQVRLARLFLGHVGDHAVVKTTRKMAASWVTDYVMKLERAPKTKLDHVVALTALYNYLARKGEYEGRNPFEGAAELLRGGKRAERVEASTSYRAWTADEIKKLTELPVGHVFRDVALICLWTGMRTEEACSLKLEDIDLSARTLSVAAGKTSAAVRVLPIAAPIVAAVERMVNTAKDAGRDHLFDLKPAGRDKKREKTLRAYRHMDRLFGDRAARNNKDGKFAAYGLRHSFNTRLAELGVDKELRGRLLGHSQEELAVATYASGEFLKQKAEAVSKLDFGIRE